MRGKQAEAKKRVWIILGKTFWACTCSEARALAKRTLGLRKHDRLPKGTVITEKLEQR
jgi:hypothetical protein